MFYIYFLPEKRSKDLQLNAAQQRISEMEAEILLLRKERDSAEHEAEERLMKRITTLEEKITELVKEKDSAEHKTEGELMKGITTLKEKCTEVKMESFELECRFVLYFNPFRFTSFSFSI
jgi:chromosome segregation ATPase